MKIIPNIRQTFLLALCAIWTLSIHAQTPTNQDCLGAIPVCSDSITISFNHNGMGNYTNEIANVSSCYAPEQRSVWFKFTIQQGGLLRFAINPANANQDHDWTLFDMTSTACSSLATTTGASGAMVRSNTWGAWGFNGPTGVSTSNGGTGACNGPGTFNGPKWCADLSVSAGSTYYLHITNWTGTVYGFTLDFSQSTAVLYDQTPPDMDSLSSSTNCHVFDSLVVDFDETILCSSLQTGDFQLVGPSGNHSITSVSGLNCVGGQAQAAVVHFSPAVSQIGQYQLLIQPNAGGVEDLCNNLDTLDTMTFFFDGAIETELTPDHIECWNECNGSVDLDIIGGTSPFTVDWSTSSSAMVINNLCAGTYTVTVTDDVGCEIIDSVEVTHPDDITTSLVSKYKTSCPSTQQCDGGAEVSASGGTFPFYYLWSSGEVGSSASALCEGPNLVTVTDSNGCLDTFEVVIETPDSIVTTGAGDTMICISNVTSVAASAVGGTPPYNYIWYEHDLNGTVIATSQVTSVSPDTTTSYTVQVVDDRGCIGDTDNVLIKVRPPLGLVLPKVDTICPYDTIDIAVAGTGGDSLYTYSWSSGQFGNQITISPDEPVYYQVTVSDVCGTPAYVDSVYIQVGGYSPIVASLRTENDSICEGESIYLIASGRGGFRGPDEYVFNWAHTNDQNPIQFVRPKITTTYTTTISDLCLSKPGTRSITIHVGTPETPVLSAQPSAICGPSEIVIRHENAVDDTRYDWYFSDGTSFLEHRIDSVRKLFRETGCVDVTIDATTAFGCVSSTELACLFEILEQPTAAFEFDPENPTNTNPYASVINTSINESSLMWFIGGDTIIGEEVVYRHFDEAGSDSLVTLIVRSDNECYDTLTRSIPFLKETLVYFPKSFTPNGDGLNDEFGIVGEAISSEDFVLEIYDRWGGVIFSTNVPTDTWNGKDRAGVDVPIGTYPFILRYRNHQGELKTLRDQVIIPKNGKRTGLR